MIEELLKYNTEFVENKRYEPYQTSKYPDRRMAIVTCAGSAGNPQRRC